MSYRRLDFPGAVPVVKASAPSTYVQPLYSPIVPSIPRVPLVPSCLGLCRLQLKMEGGDDAVRLAT